jgi:hypothetical protein
MDDKEMIVTGLRAVSGLSTVWIVAINQAKKLSVVLRLFGAIHTSEKAHTSLLCLAVANVRRKAIVRIISAVEPRLVSSKGGFMG